MTWKYSAIPLNPSSTRHWRFLQALKQKSLIFRLLAKDTQVCLMLWKQPIWFSHSCQVTFSTKWAVPWNIISSATFAWHSTAHCKTPGGGTETIPRGTLQEDIRGKRSVIGLLLGYHWLLPSISFFTLANHQTHADTASPRRHSKGQWEKGHRDFLKKDEQSGSETK